jgi:hypothetical protein
MHAGAILGRQLLRIAQRGRIMRRGFAVRTDAGGLGPGNRREMQHLARIARARGMMGEPRRGYVGPRGEQREYTGVQRLPARLRQ